jgi:LmbE family N-acetylglucosaminyl deacetylase
MRRILCIAAHPDDEILGCGGTLSKLAKDGMKCHVLIMGEGIASRGQYSAKERGRLIDALRVDAKRASQVLGVSNVVFQDYPDNMFDTVPMLEIAKSIEKLIADVSPDVIFTHNGGDLNVDHSAVYRATLTATRPIKGQCVEEVYTYEVPSSTEWAFSSIAPDFKPNTFFDIGDELNDKIKAMSEYRSEIRNYPHPRSEEALRSIAMKWGSTVGCYAAEAFALIRAVKG